MNKLKESVPGGVEYAFETAGLFLQYKSLIELLNEGYYSNNGLTSSKDEFSFPQVTLAAEERQLKVLMGSCVP